MDIYKLTSKFPAEEKFGLVSQMRRACISIASNISEGSSRVTKKDQAHFYTMAYSSTIELLNQLMISFALFFISELELNEIRMKVEPITRILNSLKRSTLAASTPQPLNP